MRRTDRAIPSVSVVMAVHNGARYLFEAIDSVLSQTMHDIELIVIDDASTDETTEMLEAWVARDDRVVVVRNDRNAGPYPSANRGLGMARAPLIARLDADDVCEPDRLAKQAEFMARHSNCVLVGSGYRSIDAAGVTRFVRHNPLDFDLAAFVARLRIPMVHPSFFFRRTLADGNPVLYDTGRPVAADFGLATSLARQGRIASMAAPLVRYRMHPNNISSTKLDRQNHFGHDIAAKAVEAHYPHEIADGLSTWLKVSYGSTEATPQSLRTAIKAFDRALVHDFGPNPPAYALDRAAGMMTEAFFARSPSARLAATLAWHGSHHLLPLARRMAQLRNLISPSETST